VGVLSGRTRTVLGHGHRRVIAGGAQEQRFAVTQQPGDRECQILGEHGRLPVRHPAAVTDWTPGWERFRVSAGQVPGLRLRQGRQIVRICAYD
jgi:hypothetical protein